MASVICLLVDIDLLVSFLGAFLAMMGVGRAEKVGWGGGGGTTLQI